MTTNFDITKNGISKRETINNSIIKELMEKYPLISVNNVTYKIGLTYYTFETNYFDTPAIRKLIKIHGAGLFGIICFFRREMCSCGWRVRVDEEYLTYLIEKCAYELRMEEADIKDCYNGLIDNHVFYVVEDNNYLDGEWLTDTQQIFNFEILNDSRAVDRKRKTAKRAKAKQDKIESDADPLFIQQIQAPEIYYEPPLSLQDV